MGHKCEEDKPAADRSGCDLIAAGRSGNWTVFIDETPAGRPQRWFLQISSHYLYLSCEIGSLVIVKKLLGYLKNRSQHRGIAAKRSDQTASLRIGTIAMRKTPVGIIRDAEDNDRCFLTVGSSGQVARVVIAGEDLQKLCDAINQLKQELVSERLL